METTKNTAVAIDLEVRIAILGSNIGSNCLIIQDGEEIYSGQLLKINMHRDVQMAEVYADRSESMDAAFWEVCLLKKPLDLISDEDALAVGKMMFAEDKDTDDTTLVRNGRALCKRLLGDYTPVVTYPVTLQIFDFVRARGYALPYGEYSVDDLVQAGIYKLVMDKTEKIFLALGLSITGNSKTIVDGILSKLNHDKEGAAFAVCNYLQVKGSDSILKVIDALAD